MDKQYIDNLERLVEQAIKFELKSKNFIDTDGIFFPELPSYELLNLYRNNQEFVEEFKQELLVLFKINVFKVKDKDSTENNTKPKFCICNITFLTNSDFDSVKLPKTNISYESFDEITIVNKKLNRLFSTLSKPEPLIEKILIS